MSNIERNRGCHSRMSTQGHRIVMYVDTPGVYFDEKGVRVTEELASAAGFNTVSDRKAYAKKRLKVNYERQIGAKFAAMEQRMEDLLENNPDLINELEVKEITPGNYAVVIGDEPVTDTRLTQEEAILLYKALTGNDFVSEADEPPLQMNPYATMDSKKIRALLKEAGVVVPRALRMPKLAIFALENMPQKKEARTSIGRDDSDLV